MYATYEITNLALVRSRIQQARDVRQYELTEAEKKVEANRLAWVATRWANDWFRRSQEYWHNVSRSDFFLRASFQYETHVGWFRGQVEAIDALRLKLDCANELSATTICLSGDDLELISLSADEDLN